MFNSFSKIIQLVIMTLFSYHLRRKMKEYMKERKNKNRDFKWENLKLVNCPYKLCWFSIWKWSNLLWFLVPRSLKHSGTRHYAPTLPQPLPKKKMEKDFKWENPEFGELSLELLVQSLKMEQWIVIFISKCNMRHSWILYCHLYWYSREILYKSTNTDKRLLMLEFSGSFFLQVILP